MRQTFLLFALLSVSISSIAQGTHAGSMKKLIGTKYKDSKSISFLKGYEFRAGSLITNVNDPESITVDHFQKGSDAVVFFSIQEDPKDEEYTVLEVLEYRNVPQGWQINTAFCRQNDIENGEIVALVKSGTEEVMKPVKQAWRFNRDKRRLQSIDKQGIDCISEGGD